MEFKKKLKKLFLYIYRLLFKNIFNKINKY